MKPHRKYGTTYEGVSLVYELLKLLPNIYVKELYTRFTKVINNLKSLGRIYPNEENVRKTLSYHAISRWGTKVVVTKEAQNLKTLSLDDLLG